MTHFRLSKALSDIMLHFDSCGWGSMIDYDPKQENLCITLSPISQVNTEKDEHGYGITVTIKTMTPNGTRALYSEILERLALEETSTLSKSTD